MILLTSFGLASKNFCPVVPDLGGRSAVDHRTFINGVLWILFVQNLPPDYDHWKNVHRRFTRWRDQGILEKFWETLALGVEKEGLKRTVEVLMVDTAPIKYIRTQQERLEGTKPSASQKGAKHKSSPFCPDERSSESL